MRCAIYCRLSREDEEKTIESESIQNQKSLLIQYVKEQQWEVYRVYSDEDYSGIDRSRPAFLQMIRDAKKGAFDAILCKTQSRFTRDMELVERYIHGLFPLWGIRFLAVADHIDTSLQGNKKARQINGLINEWYLEDLSENIRMVLNHKRHLGQHIGGFPLFGYQKDPNEKGRLIVDPIAASIVQEIFRLACEGHSMNRIADVLNQKNIPNPTAYKKEQGLRYINGSQTGAQSLWSRSSVRYILQNEMYLGTMVQGTRRKASYKSNKLLNIPKNEWIRVEGTHEAIISPECFSAVQSLHSMKRKSDGDGNMYPLSGLVKCHGCGQSMQKNSYIYRGVRQNYLRCPNRGDLCASTVRLDDLHALVEEKIKCFIQNSPPPLFQGLSPRSSDLPRESKKINRELSEILSRA